jgi:hypothetical protein
MIFEKRDFDATVIPDSSYGCFSHLFAYAARDFTCCYGDGMVELRAKI